MRERVGAGIPRLGALELALPLILTFSTRAVTRNCA
jgi:hypothetical protein